ncbi:eukaryotic translation initiation factor [Paraphaeosphaeria sporulosa]
MLLWVDQICINQSNDQEKTHQVRMMPEIYAKADKAIVWLESQQLQDIIGVDLANNLYGRRNGKHYEPEKGIYDFHNFECKSKGVPTPPFDPTWTVRFKILGNP